MKEGKIYLPKIKHWIAIRVFDTKKELQKDRLDKIIGQYSPNVYTIHPKRKIPAKLGTLYFCRDFVGVGVLTHEVQHCLFDLIEKKQWNREKHEERICWYAGEIARRVGVYFRKIKAW